MLNIRLTRLGKKKQPTYRLIVLDKRKDPWGKALEILGHYNPRTKVVEFKKDRIEYWLSVGAQPSVTVNNLLVSQNIIEGPMKRVKVKPRKKEEVKEESKVESKEATKEVKIEENKETESPQEVKTEETTQEKTTEDPKETETPNEEPKTEEVKKESTEEKPQE